MTEEYYFNVQVTNSRVLCLGPITKHEAVGADATFCDGFGHYLFLANAANPAEDIEVLARVVSEEAADRLSRVLAGKFLHHRPLTVVPAAGEAD